MTPKELELGNSLTKIIEQGDSLSPKDPRLAGVNTVDWDEARALVARHRERVHRLKYHQSVWHSAFHWLTARWVGSRLSAMCSVCGTRKCGVRVLNIS